MTVNQKKKATLRNYGICVAIEVLICFLVIWSKGFFAHSLAVNIQILSDGFFVSGFLMTAVAGLLYIGGEGGFIGIGFVLRNVADEYIVMPTGGNIAKFDGAVVLNDVSAFIFEKLLNPTSKEDIVTALVDEYDVDAQTAAKDVDALVCEFEKMGIIE